MDLVRLRIPYEFLRTRVPQSWRLLRFGLQNDLLDESAPKDMALDLIGRIREPSAALLALATAERADPMAELVDQLATEEPLVPEGDIRGQWLYLTLAWVYENRAEIADPLRMVEEVYADFDYPERIAQFVRYMPMEGPDLGSLEANERRLFDRWKAYLDEVGREQVGLELETK